MSRPFTPKKNETVHATLRCNNKNPLFHLTKNYHDIASWTNSLNCCYNVSVHHVLFMPNHIHILLTPNENNLGDAMSYFLTNLSKFLNFNNDRINHVFGNRYRPTRIKDVNHLINVIRYIYQNPVRAQLVKKVEEWPYSSLSFYTGYKNPKLMLEPDFYTRNLFNSGLDGREEWIKFISTNLSKLDVQLMKQSLNRSTMKFTVRQLRDISKAGTSLKL
jgi:putative transposase